MMPTVGMTQASLQGQDNVVSCSRGLPSMGVSSMWDMTITELYWIVYAGVLFVILDAEAAAHTDKSTTQIPYRR
jgi:hypothetical protein